VFHSIPTPFLHFLGMAFPSLCDAGLGAAGSSFFLTGLSFVFSPADVEHVEPATFFFPFKKQSI